MNSPAFRYHRTLGLLGTLGLLAFTLLLLLPSIQAQARPQYALVQKATCTACHDLPSGGGPRNINGKLFGSHGHKPAETSQSDLYYADLRTEGYYPTHKPNQQTNGLLLMVAAPTANVPIHRDPDGSSLYALLTADFGTLSSGTREVVLHWTTPREHSWLTPDHVIFGRFYLPFGLLTDEHRTYTKIQTVTSIRDYEIGAHLAWDFGPIAAPPTYHFDFALTNGFHSAGAPGPEGISYALTPNFRWNPPTLPFLLGASFTYHHTTAKPPSPYASSFYGALDIGKITGKRVPLVWLNEVALARYWNSPTRNARINFFFEQDPEAQAYSTRVQDSTSVGIYSELDYAISEPFHLNYKLDRVAFDEDAWGNAYTRHGFGFRWFFASNLQLYARYEIADAAHTSSPDSLARATQDVVWAMLRFWL